MPTNSTSSVSLTSTSTSTSSPQTMSSATNSEESQKTDPASTDSSSSSTVSTPSAPPASSPTSSSSSSSSSNPPPPPPPSPPPSSPPSHSPTPPPSTPSPSPPANSPSNPTSNTPTNSPPSQAPAPPSDSSSGASVSPSPLPSETQTPGTTVPSSAPSSPAISAGPATNNNVTSGLAGSPSTSPTSSLPHGAPITAISTVLVTTQAGGEIVTLTTILSDPTLSTNTLPGQHSGVNTRAIAAASVIGGLAVISVAAWGLFTFRRKRRRYHIERDSATAAMVAAGVLPPPFNDSPNVTPNIERGSTTQYFEDGTPITSILESFNPYAYPAVGPRTSSNGTSTPSGVEFNGSGPKRSPSERSDALLSVGHAYEPISRSQSPPDLAAAAAAIAYPPTAFSNLRRSMRSSNSSSEDSHSQGHTSFVILQQPPQPQPFAPPISPSSHSHSHSQIYTYPHVYVSNVVPAGTTSPPGSGHSHEDHEAMTISLPRARSQNQLPSPAPHDLTPDETPEMQEAYHLLTGTPAGIPVSSSEISIGYGNGGEGYGSLLTTRPRLEIRNRTGSFKTTNSETSKNDASER